MIPDLKQKQNSFNSRAFLENLESLSCKSQLLACDVFTILMIHQPLRSTSTTSELGFFNLTNIWALI